MAKQNLNTNVGTVVDTDHFDLFEGFTATSIGGVRIHYIGQGDAISIFDDGGEPILFLDYGGLGDHPDKPSFTNTGSRLALARSSGNLVSIVLTHWDKDHYYSAKKVPLAEQCRWLTPRQKVGVQAATFSGKINNMFSWPDDKIGIGVAFGTTNGDFVMIEKIAASPTDPDAEEDRNHSGLAMSVVKDRSASGDKNQLIILPGDAPFHEINHLEDLRNECSLRGVVAYHHGSHVSWKHSNNNETGRLLEGDAVNPKLVYSFGPSNTYGHPDESNYDNLTWLPVKEKTPPQFHGSNYPEFIDILF